MIDSERAIAFIDEANLARQANHLGIEIDYHSLISYLKKEYNLIRAYLYTGSDLSQPRINNFVYMIKRAGYRVVHHRTPQRSDGSIKANLDVHLAVDMVSLSEFYDIGILISGDGDFAPALDAISRKGVRVDVISLEEHTSSVILDLADNYINLKELSEQIEYRRNDKFSRHRHIKNSYDQDTHLEDERVMILCRKILSQITSENLPTPINIIPSKINSLDKSFDVKNTSYASYKNFFKHLEDNNIIKTNILGNTTYIIQINYDTLNNTLSLERGK